MARLDEDIAERLFDEEQLAARIKELGAQLSKDYAGKELDIVVILRGAFMFVADLVRHLDLDVSVGFMVVSSYGAATKTSGKVRIVKDLQRNIEGRHVLIVEDIVDTGLTVQHLLRFLASRDPASIKTCTLLSKPSCRRVEVPVEYTGFEIPNKFVVGYGLDYDQRYRQLPYIGVLTDEAIAKGA